MVMMEMIMMVAVMVVEVIVNFYDDDAENGFDRDCIEKYKDGDNYEFMFKHEHYLCSS